MRTRPLKPSFWKNEALAECEIWTRLLYLGLASLADRRGRLKYEPKKIKVSLFPYDDNQAVPVVDGLEQLAKRGLIDIYEVAGAKYIRFTCNFEKHARPHPDEKHDETIPEPPPNQQPLNPTADVESAVGNHGNPRPTLSRPLNHTASCAALPIASFPIPDSPLPSPEPPALPVEREVPSAMQMDRSKDARELVEVYFRVITNAHPGQGVAKSAILYAWDQRPQSTRADFERAIANYRKHLNIHKQNHPKSPVKFFRDEAIWLEFIDWKPPDSLPQTTTTRPDNTLTDDEKRARLLGQKGRPP